MWYGKYRSSGLGLSVSYGIISRHRGTVTVKSEEGKGTTFTIMLPLLEELVEEGRGEPVPGEVGKAQVLVIENEEQVRNLLSSILTMDGHKVETTADGSQGIELFKKRKFDLVL